MDALLCWNLNLVIKEFRGEICSIRPAEGVEFGVDGKRLKNADIPEWLEDLTTEFIGEINVAFRSIRKADVYGEITLVPCRDNLGYHGFTPTVQSCLPVAIPARIQRLVICRLLVTHNEAFLAHPCK
jgi:hypothetical protein